MPAHLRSVRPKPDAPLLLINLGQAVLALDDNSRIDEAIGYINRSMDLENDNPLGWRLLSEAYDRKGDAGMARLAAAEQNFALGNMRDAQTFATPARELLPKDTPQWRRAQDIISPSPAVARTPRPAKASSRTGPKEFPMRLLHLALAALAVLTLTSSPQASDPGIRRQGPGLPAGPPRGGGRGSDPPAGKLIAAAIAQVRPILERDPRDFVANPGGKITIMFKVSDYQCGHCINIAPAVLDIIKRNPDVRFVFKEMPILGATPRPPRAPRSPSNRPAAMGLASTKPS